MGFIVPALTAVGTAVLGAGGAAAAGAGITAGIGAATAISTGIGIAGGVKSLIGSAKPPATSPLTPPTPLQPPSLATSPITPTVSSIPKSLSQLSPGLALSGTSGSLAAAPGGQKKTLLGQ